MKPSEQVQVKAAVVLAALPADIVGHIAITLAEKLAGAMNRERALTGKLPLPPEFSQATAARFILLAARDNGVDVQVSDHGPENSGAAQDAKQPEPAPEQFPEPTAEQIEQAEKLLKAIFGKLPK